MKANPVMSVNRQNIRKNTVYMVSKASFFGAIVLFCLSGCSGFTSVDAKFGRPVGVGGVHIVSKGETLYSIAWDYGWDYKALASANSIYYPYLIYPGQSLKINRNQYQVTTKARTAQKGSKVLTSQQKPSASVTPSAYKNRLAEPLVSTNKEKIQWHWPFRGEVIAKFSANAPVNKGIDIGGRIGEPVMAAAAGTVVYAGSGLLGYGNLVIVKHNDRYLSAYAHNQRLLVKENQQVTANQPIAELGSSGTDTVKLHFEIRRDGKPVNPMNHLPKAG